MRHLLPALPALFVLAGCYLDEPDPYGAEQGTTGGETYVQQDSGYGYAPPPQPQPQQTASPPPSVTTTVETGAEPPLSGDALVAAILSGIQVVSETERVLSPRARDLFFSYVTPMLPEPIQMIPEQRGGQVAGLRIRGIAPGRVLEGMGFRNEDLVMAVDGRPMRSAVDALTAFTGLQGAGQTAVQVERGGVPVLLRFRVQ